MSRRPTAAVRAVRRRLEEARGDESGLSLIELSVSILIVGIVLSMTVVIVSTFFTSAAQTQRVGNATAIAQDTMARVDQLLRGAISPLSAQSATPSASGACWGATSPSPTGLDSGDSADVHPAPNWLTAWNSPSNSFNATGGVTLNSLQTQSLSVVVAHDFDIWFCAYHAVGGSNVPHLMEITVDRSACENTDPNGGYCPLQVIDHGANCIPGADNSGCGSAVINTLPDIWCDQFCQGAHQFPETYGNVSSSPVVANFAVACVNQPAAFKPAGGCASATPPLFSYYLGNNVAGGGGQCYSSSSCTAPPVNGVAQTIVANNPAGSTMLVPAPYCTLNCATTLDLSASAALNTSNLATQILLGIQLVVVNFDAGAPASSSQPLLAKGTPGTQLSNQVFLVNQLTKGTSGCTYDAAVQSVASAPAGNWPMTDGGGSGQIPNVNDLSSNGNGGTFYGSPPPTENQPAGNGPISCLVSSKAMAFNPLDQQYITTNKAYCSLANQASCPIGSIALQQGFSVVAWFQTSASGSVNPILSFADQPSLGSLPTNYDRELYVDPSGNLAWEVCPNLGAGLTAPNCTSPTAGAVTATTNTMNHTQNVTYDDGNWHMVVATIGPATFNQALQAGGGGQYLYADGHLVASNSATASGAYTGYLNIGGMPTGAGGVAYFNGIIGRVAIIPTVLSPGQVARLYGDSGIANACFTSAVDGAQPVGYYPLANDTKDYGPISPAKADEFNGTNIGTTQGLVPPANGGPPALCDQQLGASQFVSPNDYVDLGRPGTFGVNWAPQQFSVEAWVDLTSSATASRLVANSRTDCSGTGFELVVLAGGTSGFFDVGTNPVSPAGCNSGLGIQASPVGWVAQWNAPPSPSCVPVNLGGVQIEVPKICNGQWYFVVGTYDGAVARVFVDGTQVAETPGSGAVGPGSPGTFPCGTCTVNIGRDPEFTTDYLNGYEANVAIFATALSGAQIQAQYQAGVAS
ncbi:MAG TPA: LamG-like jellyroll fold domain-containing protein [Acidimicrobiales bacterium]|nr:LamG-like jellyroll fold domain-containing protein [Acidimicrobiales bacterium]